MTLMTEEKAQQTMEKLEVEAAELHLQIKALKQQKNQRTMMIARLRAFIDAAGKPNPIPGGTIGL